jgi:hypothetical protein
MSIGIWISLNVSVLNRPTFIGQQSADRHHAGCRRAAASAVIREHALLPYRKCACCRRSCCHASPASQLLTSTFRAGRNRGSQFAFQRQFGLPASALLRLALSERFDLHRIISSQTLPALRHAAALGLLGRSVSFNRSACGAHSPARQPLQLAGFQLQYAAHKVWITLQRGIETVDRHRQNAGAAGLGHDRSAIPPGRSLRSAAAIPGRYRPPR